MGRAADPWRAAETWIQCVASDSVPAKAGLSTHPDLAHLPAESGVWDREQLAELNLVAGRRAKVTTAYVSALTTAGAPCCRKPRGRAG
jgi:hypothetical protein